MRIAIEGNIGCGKSTVIDRLREWGIDAKPEPIQDWGSLLTLAYKNPRRWSFAFNLRVLVSMTGIPRDIVIERSPLATRSVFAQIGFNSGNMSTNDFETFKAVYDEIGWEPDAIIFIHTPSHECFRRISTRGRKCESGIGPDYVTAVEFQYANMLRAFKGPVATVNGLQDPETVAKSVFDAVTSLRQMK